MQLWLVPGGWRLIELGDVTRNVSLVRQAALAQLSYIYILTFDDLEYLRYTCIATFETKTEIILLSHPLVVSCKHETHQGTSEAPTTFLGIRRSNGTNRS